MIRAFYNGPLGKPFKFLFKKYPKLKYHAQALYFYGSDPVKWKPPTHADQPPSPHSKVRPLQFSILTTVFDTPAQFFDELIDSILGLSQFSVVEWVILDNGSRNKDTLLRLDRLRDIKNIRILRVENNIGIIKGMRLCLEQSQGEFIIPVDSDDLVSPNTLEVFAHYLERFPKTKLLFSDEDKVIHKTKCLTYRKPGWDPVLFSNSCYIAHLTAISRVDALRLGCYLDSLADGSHDWDTFFKFYADGIEPIHVPEVLYSWRMHSGSTAQNIQSKSYIHRSHLRVLNHFLSVKGLSDRFIVEYNPLFNGKPDWKFTRLEVAPSNAQIVFWGDQGAVSDDCFLNLVPLSDYFRYPIINSPEFFHKDISSREALLKLENMKAENILFLDPYLKTICRDAFWEFQGIAELFPETVAMGGLIFNEDGSIETVTATNKLSHLNPGRTRSEPGYFARNWKYHSAEEISFNLLLIKRLFLLEVLGTSKFEAFKELPIKLSQMIGSSKNRFVFNPLFIGQK